MGAYHYHVWNRFGWLRWVLFHEPQTCRICGVHPRYQMKGLSD